MKGEIKQLKNPWHAKNYSVNCNVMVPSTFHLYVSEF